MSLIIERSTSAGLVDHIGLPFASGTKVPPRTKMPEVCSLTFFRRCLRFSPSGLMAGLGTFFVLFGDGVGEFFGAFLERGCDGPTDVTHFIV